MKTEQPLGLYIHVPFCEKKCRYCDFYSVTQTELVTEYTKAVKRNIENYGDINFDTVYFGGGTPSLLSPVQIDDILQSVKKTRGCEITLECNPNSAAENYFKNIAEIGVNRVSVGVQSLNNKTLKTLGRLHDAETAVKTLSAAVKHFKNVSVDLIIGLPNETSAEINNSIKLFSDLGVKHLSVYMLKIEEGTPFYENPPQHLPDEDAVIEIYLDTVKCAEENGFLQYEISNFAQPGFESRHNLKYWECKEYIGIGPAAHSFTGGKRFAVKPDLTDFLAANVQNTYYTDENPGGMDERVMLNLRLTQKGIIAPENAREKFSRLSDGGFIRLCGEKLTLTPKGCTVSNTIISEIIDKM
jgi:oxygen-independent coproporphyrinogen-3 oxidase